MRDHTNTAKRKEKKKKKPHVVILSSFRSLIPQQLPTEYKKIVLAVTVGFGVMGVIGFLIKLVFIPINQILVA